MLKIDIWIIFIPELRMSFASYAYTDILDELIVTFYNN